MGEDIRLSLKTGLSVAARDCRTGKMIGVQVSVLLDREHPQRPAQPTAELVNYILSLTIGSFLKWSKCLSPFLIITLIR